jgi:hypothetical protein
MTLTQQRLCESIAKHLKVKKAIVADQVKNYLQDIGDHPVVDINLTDTTTIRVGATNLTLKCFGDLLNYKRFAKTELFANLSDMFENHDVDFCVFYSKTLVAVSIADMYNGLGGVFVKENNDTSSLGYVIEPAEHLLQRVYPVTLVD